MKEVWASVRAWAARFFRGRSAEDGAPSRQDSGRPAALRRVWNAAAGWLNRHTAVRDYLHRVAVLSVLLIAVVLMLAGVHRMTAPRIAARTRDVWGETRAVLPAATRLDPLAHDTAAAALFAAYDNQTVLGYCIEMRAFGFGGELALLVVTDPEGRIAAVRVLRHSETTGLGGRVTDGAFLAQFAGLAAPVEEIDTISGSTISSRAVIDGVRGALAALHDATGRGGQGNG